MGTMRAIVPERIFQASPSGKRVMKAGFPVTRISSAPATSAVRTLSQSAAINFNP
jgi:hypothetical protein